MRPHWLLQEGSQIVPKPPDHSREVGIPQGADPNPQFSLSLMCLLGLLALQQGMCLILWWQTEPMVPGANSP